MFKRGALGIQVIYIYGSELLDSLAYGSENAVMPLVPVLFVANLFVTIVSFYRILHHMPLQEVTEGRDTILRDIMLKSFVH